MTGGEPAAIDRRDEIAADLRLFIVDELLEDPYVGPDPLADGVVDSLAVEQLVEYVHERFGVELDDGDMVVENFETLTTLATLVAGRAKTSDGIA